MIVAEQEKQFCRSLRDFPRLFNNRYEPEARSALLQLLFHSLVNDNPEYLDVLFNHHLPSTDDDWSLREAQGAVDGSEYAEAARGKPCGHIFKAGEATYRCKTCTLDDTCVLCSRCYESSDHAGHMIQISVSPGNSGCCDCGDVEAWRIPVNCAIHSTEPSAAPAKDKEAAKIPAPLSDSIRSTIGRALDYVCDVISCSPEQLRLTKSEESIREDERASRLTKSLYADGDEVEDDPEFALVLWNDEKHGIYEVQDQVARACKKARSFGLEKARETDDVGRSVITYSSDLQELLDKARIIENIKITVTIRSARDTFREQMCSTIIEWLLDISGCSVGPDHDILKQTVCKEMLKAWRPGSTAANATVGKEGIDDHEIEEAESQRDIFRGRIIQNIPTRPDGNVAITILQPASDDEDDDDEDDQNDQDTQTQDGDPADLMDLDLDMASDHDLDMRAAVEPTDELEVEEATLAGYPPPPPPPPPAPPSNRGSPHQERRREILTPSASSSSSATIRADGEEEDASEAAAATPRAVIRVPPTPYSRTRAKRVKNTPSHWMQRPAPSPKNVPLAEDIKQRVRLDWMILFDLRLWKKARVDLRDLYISTVVTVPDFKRILGLRFAGLYTVLAQLYLIADREPDHSIIYLSLQMLTTPSITQEIIEKGNFLTNLIAILYTFLTTRQVGDPADCEPNATLAFDAGSVTNRRMYHFFMDMKHLFLSRYVQEQLREKPLYVVQFLDLIRLPQGICPNQRAIGEHVEYETDAWISASILTRELNRLCRQFAEAFRWRPGEDFTSTSRTIRIFAWAAITNSVGVDRARFIQSEIKHEIELKDHKHEGFEMDESQPYASTVVKFVVEEGHISFHHALHYTLSWLIDGTKSMAAEDLRRLLMFSHSQLENDGPTLLRGKVPEMDSEGYLVVMFDYPLRVCAWLAQMKAGMWVRNGLSLRHQMSTYRGVAPRDLAYKQDIFLLQAAMVTCNPERMLLSMVDRFGMDEWMRGKFVLHQGWEDIQMLDVAEDFIHLLIVLATERTALHAIEDEPMPQHLAIMRELTHILCFKTLSFSELTSRLAEKFQEQDDFQEILEQMTNFKPPESLNDSGLFELKKEYLGGLDPYIAHYTKNQRDEAETKYREWVSEATGKPLDEVVLEPKLQPIKSGIFKNLTEFTKTRLFTQVIYNSLQWGLTAHSNFPNIPPTRVEAFLTVVLHLALIAVLEESPEETHTSPSSNSFVCRLLCGNAPFPEESPNRDSVFLALNKLLQREELTACHPRIRVILLRARQRRPSLFSRITSTHGIAVERLGTESPANASTEDLEAKKQQALDRKAKVMAQFQKQQQDFMSNQTTIDWGVEDFEDSDAETMEQEEHKKVAKYPSGNCILCQEETNDTRLYGTFALLTESNILRQTDFKDPDYVHETVELPSSLDRSAEAIRPFGVGGQNKIQVRKFTSDGFEVMGERQGLGKGFDASNCRPGPVSVGCGHIMHYSCFELYCGATQRRQTHQIARNHPERLDRLEFVCPLCKALGNTFLPIIWKPKDESYPGVLQTETSFTEWLQVQIGLAASRYQKASIHSSNNPMRPREQEIFTRNISNTLIPPSALALFDRMSTDPGPTSPLRSSMANLPGIFPEETSPTQPTVSETFALEGLMVIYARIRETFKKNNLPSQFSYDARSNNSESLTHTDVLAAALGWSISATEISQRGVQSEAGTLLLDKIPYLTLTHLRILAETAASYIAVGGLRGGGNNRPTSEFYQLQGKQLLQLLGGHPQIFEEGSPMNQEFLGSQTGTAAALSLDSFVLLTETSVFLVPALQVDIMHMVQLCYLLEIVKVVMNVQHHSKKEYWQFDSTRGQQTVSPETVKCFGAFARFFESQYQLPTTISEDPALQAKVCQMIASYALVYLRKVVILLHVSHGVDFPNSGYADADEPELDRITRALRLPSLAEMFTLACAQTESGERTALGWVMGNWIEHFRHMCKQSYQHLEDAIAGFRPSHPGIFELIGLPKYYDTLLDEVMRRRCPTTKKDLVDPAICLFCGAIFCSQAVCCSSKNGLGGCNQHLATCGKNVGVFINLRKCCVLYLHDGNGTWTNAPYLDKHGEVDPGLRRTRQLMLSEKRYDGSLRNVWLNHMIPTTVSRKLEADINNGGWETL